MDKKNHISTGKIYAFDFDGTLCQEAYPAIGKPNRSMIRFVKKVQNRGHRTILWTCRCGKPLEEAVNWCKEPKLSEDTA
jgi:hydroxymethylpyrimidine pyrophosphatase-like HAD family hydrolase